MRLETIKNLKIDIKKEHDFLVLMGFRKQALDEGFKLSIVTCPYDTSSTIILTASKEEDAK